MVGDSGLDFHSATPIWARPGSGDAGVSEDESRGKGCRSGSQQAETKTEVLFQTHCNLALVLVSLDDFHTQT